MKLEIIDITPELAAEMLEKNTGNFRTLSRMRVNTYATAMLLGKWEENGETIKFSNEKLIDGQTRLHAIIKSGRTIRTAVAWDINSAGLTVDTGQARTAGQWLQHLGMKSGNAIASASRLCILHARGRWAKVKSGQVTQFDSDIILKSEIISFATDHYDELLRCIHLAAKYAGIERSSLVTVLFVGSQKDKSMSEWFIEKLVTGTDLQQGEPVLALRNMLANQRANSERSAFMKRMLLTLAWNKTVAGESCAILKVTMSGPTATKLPNFIAIA